MACTNGHISRTTHLGVCNERHTPPGGWHNLAHPVFPRIVRNGLDVCERILPLFEGRMKYRTVGKTKWSIGGIRDVEAAIGRLDSGEVEERRNTDWGALSKIYTSRTFLSDRLGRVVRIGLCMMMKRGDGIGLRFAWRTFALGTNARRGGLTCGSGRCGGVGALDGGGAFDRDREAGGKSSGRLVRNFDRHCGCTGAGGTGAGRATSTGGSAARSGTRMHGGRGNGTRRKDRAP